MKKFSVSTNELPGDSRIFIQINDEIIQYDFKTNKTYMPHKNENILTFDVVDLTVFYIKRNSPIIYKPDGNVEFSEKVEPQAMAVDYLTKKIYILVRSAGTVSVMDFKGKSLGVILSDLEKLDDIVLDMEHGLMFILQYRKSVN